MWRLEGGAGLVVPLLNVNLPTPPISPAPPHRHIAASPPRRLAASPPADGKLDVLEIKKRVTATKIHAMGVHKSITALNVFEVGDADDDK